LILALVLGAIAQVCACSGSQPSLTQAVKASNASNDTKSAEFCSNLKTIIQASDSEFESIRGNPDPGTYGQGYVSKVRVQGSGGCTVWFPDSWVSCSLGSYPDEGRLAYSYEDFAGKMRRCLSGWPVARQTAESRRLKGVEFLGPQGVVASIEVFSKNSPHVPGYMLILSVSREPINEK
jgi:hypothetical protein